MFTAVACHECIPQVVFPCLKKAFRLHIIFPRNFDPCFGCFAAGSIIPIQVLFNFMVGIIVAAWTSRAVGSGEAQIKRHSLALTTGPVSKHFFILILILASSMQVDPILLDILFILVPPVMRRAALDKNTIQSSMVMCLVVYIYIFI